MGPQYLYRQKITQIVGAKLWVTGRVASVVSRALIDFYAKFRETGVFPVETFEAAPPGPMGDKLLNSENWISGVK